MPPVYESRLDLPPYWTSVPSVHRVIRWRGQIGIDPHPFADIPRKQCHHKRYARIAECIRAEEAKLVGQLTGINDDLEKRRKALTAAPPCNK